MAPTGAVLQRPTEGLRQAGVAWEPAGLHPPAPNPGWLPPMDGENNVRSHPASPFGCTLENGPCTPIGPGMPVGRNAHQAACLAWSDALRWTEPGGWPTATLDAVGGPNRATQVVQ